MGVSHESNGIRTHNHFPADADVLKSSRRLATKQDVVTTSDLRRLVNARLTSPWRRPIYDVLKTSDLQRLQDT